VGSLHFMRLSLKERRTRGPVQSRVQEIGAIDGCPMRLPRVKASVLPAVSAPILRVLCEGWDDQISPLNLPRKTDLFLRRPGCSVEGCPAYAPCPCGHNDRSDLPVALCALSAPQLPVPHTPGFLWTFVCSLNFLRLSLMKSPHAVLSRAAYRKFGASRSFFASLPRGDRSTRVP
jgi:hypothetical protein